MQKLNVKRLIQPLGRKFFLLITPSLNTKKYSGTRQNYWVFLHIVIFGYNATLL